MGEMTPRRHLQSRTQLRLKRGAMWRRIGRGALAPGAVGSLVVDALTWVVAREGSPVRIALGVLLLLGALVSVGVGLLLDACDRRHLSI